MSTVSTDTVKALGPNQDLTIGTTGQTVTLPGNDLRVNTFKDKGGNTLWTSDGADVDKPLIDTILNYDLTETTNIGSVILFDDFTIILHFFRILLKKHNIIEKSSKKMSFGSH